MTTRMIADICNKPRAGIEWPLKRGVLVTAMCLMSASCATVRVRPDPQFLAFSSVKLPARAWLKRDMVQKDKVSVAVYTFDQNLMKAIFGTDLMRDGIQPLMIVIDNNSEHTYTFKKSSVNPQHIPAEDVANKVIRRKDRIFTFVRPLLLPLLVFPPTGMALSVGRGEDNANIRAGFRLKELDDGDIAPLHHLYPQAPTGPISGIVFVQPLQRDDGVGLTLVNAQTQLPLSFEIVPTVLDRRAFTTELPK